MNHGEADCGTKAVRTTLITMTKFNSSYIIRVVDLNILTLVKKGKIKKADS